MNGRTMLALIAALVTQLGDLGISTRGSQAAVFDEALTFAGKYDVREFSETLRDSLVPK